MAGRSFDVAIVGGGPGGYTAALYVARGGFSVAVIEKLSPGGQMATTETVENYPGFDEINGFELGLKMQKGAERFGAITLYEEVTAVDLTSELKRLTASDGEITARAVILATGAQPRELGADGEKEAVGRGVAYCATCDGMRYKGKTVIVVGGGNSAAAEALYLARICEKVYLVHRRGELRASPVYAKQLAGSGVEFVWNSRIERIIIDKSVVGAEIADVNTGDKRELPCSAVFVAVGRVPETDMFCGQIELDNDGYIIAGENTETSASGVYAVGDVRAKPLRQIATAVADGATASAMIERYLH